MLVPTGGFGWVTGGRETATPAQSECLLSLSVGSPTEVDASVAQAWAAGATVVYSAEEKPWGYAGAFADPDGHVWMVTASG